MDDAAAAEPEQAQAPLLVVRDVVQEFAVRGSGLVNRSVVHAVSGVSFELQTGEVIGIVGETGSGKSTLARCVFAAPPPKSGQVLFRGVDILKLTGRELRQTRQGMQMIYQDPFGSLDPKWHVFDIVEEPLRSYRVGDSGQRKRRVDEVLDLVGLDPGIYGSRRPGQLSGGQCQRVAIARALTLSPALLVCDEAVSSLDVVIRSQVMNLFEELRRELSLSYLFIAHDLAVVKQISDRVAVMYLGRLAEIGPAESLYARPMHPYTAALLSSIPTIHGSAPEVPEGVLASEPPSPLDPPSGCRFRTRCPRAQELCAQQVPEIRELRKGHLVACHYPLIEDERPAKASSVAEIDA